MPLYLLIFLAAAVALICLGVPLIQRRVPPNHWYGFRVPSTLADANVWYPANEYAAWQFVWLGIAGIVVAIAAYLIPGIQTDMYASIIGVFYLVGVPFTVVRSFVFLHSLTADKSKKRSHKR
ncbi:SdpI family protein [Planctomycetaceae bacterium SH139]|jgi:uncharacterized membrane protein